MDKIGQVIGYLDELYPAPVCALEFSTPFELLIAVMLSAQCTDKRVNIVTKKLFKVANTPDKILSLGEDKLKDIIHPCGFFNAKAKAIMQTCHDLIEKFNGVVPNDLQTLTSLRGVGRKTANVVIGTAFGGQTIAVDTHVHRVSKRLGLAKENSSAFECEMALLNVVPENKRTKFHHQTIWFGREHCKAIKPLCEDCKLKNICNYFKEKGEIKKEL